MDTQELKRLALAKMALRGSLDQEAVRQWCETLRELRQAVPDWCVVVRDLIEENERLQSAAKTLSRLGYEDKGGEQWKPPLGRKPDFDLIDQLRAENEQLKADAKLFMDSDLVWQGAREAEAEIIQLKAENEALLRDAERVAAIPQDMIRKTFNDAYYAPREIGSDAEQIRAGVLAVLMAAKEARS